MEKIVYTDKDLEEVIGLISFRKSCVELDWKWDWQKVYDDAERNLGWLVRTSFVRPDTVTGKVSRGFGRWEFVSLGSTESAVVKTCWVLADMNIYHELMESYQYKGVRIFNPHHTVEELSLPQLVKDGKVSLHSIEDK